MEVLKTTSPTVSPRAPKPRPSNTVPSASTSSAFVSFLLLFFNTFAGAQAVDRDWIATLQIMGATRREQFQKAVAPACIPWIMSGLKNALPYSLIAATIGEIMLAREGLGYLITDSASQFDMTGIYTSLYQLIL